MSDFQIEVLLQLHPEPSPKRVEVSPRQLHFLDCHSDRSFASDGTVLYTIEEHLWHEEEMSHSQGLAAVA